MPSSSSELDLSINALYLQVTDRQSWRAALESGQYELLNVENKENGIMKNVTGDVEEMETDDHARVIVRDR